MELPAYPDILARCVQLVAAAKKLPPESISESTTFESLGIDSLEKINLSFEVEEAFGISIPDQALTTILSVHDMATGVQQLLSLQNPPATTPSA